MVMLLFGCQNHTREKLNAIQNKVSIQPKKIVYDKIIDSLGMDKLYTKAKWIMFCLYCDSPVRFKPSIGKDEVKTYGDLELSLDSLILTNDTTGFLFKFLFNEEVCDTDMVYSYNFTWWGVRFIRNDTNNVQLFMRNNKDVCRYFKPEDPFGKHLKKSLPNVVKYVNDNKTKINAWFRNEAIKRELVE